MHKRETIQSSKLITQLHKAELQVEKLVDAAKGAEFLRVLEGTE